MPRLQRARRGLGYPIRLLQGAMAMLLLLLLEGADIALFAGPAINGKGALGSLGALCGRSLFSASAG